MVMMFNELSIQKVSNPEAASVILQRFVRAYARAREIGFQEIRLFEKIIPTIYRIEICDDYNIDLWLKDRRVDENVRDIFKGMLTNSPLITEQEVEENDFFSRSEFYFDIHSTKYQAWGLGAAHIYDTLSISLATQAHWEEEAIKLRHFYLTNSSEEINEEIRVRNFTTVENLERHAAWWEQRQLNAVNQGAELWEKRSEFFPDLEFCQEVQRQFSDLGWSKTLIQIVDRLKSLNDYVTMWKGQTGAFSYEDVNNNTNLRISPESPATLRKFGTLRKFHIPGRGKEVFDLHIKTGNLRFHFYPDAANRKVYIGYIGKHLRISSQD